MAGFTVEWVFLLIRLKLSMIGDILIELDRSEVEKFAMAKLKD
jgi:hypothetical protein